VTNVKFNQRNDFNRLKYISSPNLFFNDNYADTTIAEIRFDKKIARRIKDEFEIIDSYILPSGDIVCKIPVIHNAWLLNKLREYGADIKILSPENLKNELFQDYIEILKLYS
jgi:predicted DNA-binding transcriptional regulator YafY